jgi:hypothetical protein
MGFLKKITRPISRALDKIIPNEVKPALPFLAAAAPFMAPGLMGLGGNTMLSRALMSGGLNLGAQLAQEGSEGDFSGLSTLMAAATGALSTPGSAGGRTIGDTGKSYSQYMGGDSLASTGTQSAGDFFKNKALGMEPGFAKSGLGALEGTSNYLAGTGETLRNNLFSKEGLKAALVPVGQGFTDLAVAENRRALKDYERDMADAEAEQGASDANRAFAIRQSMEAYGFTEQEILDAIEAAGYANGGRVGFEFGGIPAAVESVEEKPKEFLVDKLKVTVQPGQSEQMAIMNAMMNDIDEVMPEDRKMEFYKLYLPQLRASGEISENEYEGLMGELFGEGKAEGGIMNLGGREMDMRTGGFIPIGKKERADDVPARLSKNEFVMTADAVRAAGGGSVNEGARRMYNLMNNLEARV